MSERKISKGRRIGGGEERENKDSNGVNQIPGIYDLVKMNPAAMDN